MVWHKIDHWRKTCGANVRLIMEVIKNVANDVVSMICIFSLLIYKQHLDPTTSRKLLINSIGYDVWMKSFETFETKI